MPKKKKDDEYKKICEAMSNFIDDVASIRYGLSISEAIREIDRLRNERRRMLYDLQEKEKKIASLERKLKELEKVEK